MSTALYRRYRPDTFDEVIGQEHVTDPLKAALARNRVNHAYLFSGPRGCGKTTSARILARCLNCAQGPTDAPCGECDSCRELATGGGGSLDVVEIDAASHNGVDDARDLRERAIYAPARDRFKVFILDEAHMVTTQGFNALLKLVEEPPPHVKFIFATTEPDKVIGTIRSRTHHYPFRLVPPERLAQYLEELSRREQVPIGKGVLPLVVRAGGGSVRDTLSVLDQLMAGAGENGIDYGRAVTLLGYTHITLLDDVVDGLAAGDGAAVYRVVERVIESGHDPRRFVEDLLERFRDLIVIAAAADAAPALLPELPADQLERMVLQARSLGAAELSRAADLVHAGLAEMSGATSPRLQLDLICARLLLPAGDGQAASLQARLERMERRIGMSATGTVSGATQTAGSQTTGQEGPLHESARTEAPQPSQPEPARAASQPKQAGPPSQSTRAWGDPESAPRNGPAPHRSDADRAEGPMAGAQAPAEVRSGERTQQEAVQDEPARDEPGRDDGIRNHTAGHPPQGQPPTPEAVQPSPAPENDTPEETSPATAGTEIDAIRRAWPEILNELSGMRKLVWALVNQDATAHSFENGVLRLGFRTPSLAQRFTKSDFGPTVAEAVHRQLGVSSTVAAIADDGAPPSSHPAGATNAGSAAPPERSSAPAGSASPERSATPAQASSRETSAPTHPQPAEEQRPEEPAPSQEDHWRPVEPPSDDPNDPWYTPAEEWDEPGLEPERTRDAGPAVSRERSPRDTAPGAGADLSGAPVTGQPDGVASSEPPSVGGDGNTSSPHTDYLGAYADLDVSFAEDASPAAPVTGTAPSSAPGSRGGGSRFEDAKQGREAAAERLRQFFKEPSAARPASAGEPLPVGVGSSAASGHVGAVQRGESRSATPPPEPGPFNSAAPPPAVPEPDSHDEIMSDDDPDQASTPLKGKEVIEEILGGVVIEEIEE